MWQKMESPAIENPLDYICLFVKYDSKGGIEHIYKTDTLSEADSVEKFLIRFKKVFFIAPVTIHQHFAIGLLKTHKIVTDLES